PDGKKLTYYSAAAGKRKLYLRDLENGTQKELAPSWFFPPGAAYGAPLVQGGGEVFFVGSSAPESASATYVLDVNGGVPVLVKEKLFVMCASEDGRYALLSRGGKDIAVDTQTHEEFAVTS